MRIQGNKWFRNSQEIGGNAIDFLVDYYGLSPNEAIKKLLQDTGYTVNKKNGVKEKNKITRPGAPGRFDFNDIAIACDQRRVIAYLVKSRGIPPDIVLAEIQKGQLFQESQTGNAIFVMINEAGVIVGAEVVGTLNFENARFKGLKAGSVSGYGYTVGQKKNPRFILYFESAVDLLSFIIITRVRAKPLTACLLVSMAGLKFGVIHKSLKVFGNQYATPVLCVDNDEAGNRFIDHCLFQYPSAIIKQPDKNYKDWNDQLRGKTIVVNC